MDKRFDREPLPLVRTVSILLLTLAFLIPGAVSAAPLQKVKIGYSAATGGSGPLWTAYEVGIFRKYGLDVELIYLKGGTKAIKGLVKGDVDFVQAGAAGVLRSHLKGKSTNVVMIAGLVNTLPYQLIVNKSITRPEQLRGKALAVSRFGGSSDFATRYAIEKFGLVPMKEVNILEIGGQSDRLEAITEGKVDGAMLAVPYTLLAKRLGHTSLADLQMLGLEYQHTGLATTKTLIKSRPRLVQKFLTAFVEGIFYYKTHRQEALEVLTKYLKKSDDPEVVEETYNVMGLTLLPEKPYPTLRGIKVMLNRLAKKNPNAKTAKPEEFVNMSFMKRLDGSGLIDRMYKLRSTMASRSKQRKSTTEASIKKTSIQSAARRQTMSRVTATPVKAVSQSSRRDMKEHTIKAGETLSQLARRYYGDMFKWRKIYNANRHAMKSPNSLFVGQKIVIP